MWTHIGFLVNKQENWILGGGWEASGYKSLNGIWNLNIMGLSYSWIPVSTFQISPRFYHFLHCTGDSLVWLQPP